MDGCAGMLTGGVAAEGRACTHFVFGKGQFGLPRLVALCDVACGRLHTPTRHVEGCPREGPGPCVRAERREIMLCYVIKSFSLSHTRPINPP